MGKARLAALLSAVLAWAPAFLQGVAAEAGAPSGTWLVGGRLAPEIAECNYLYCGRIVWVRQGAPGI